jgi:hypothetical protein
LLSGTVQGDRQLFFYNGGYDEEVFVKGEAARQTVTIGELRECKHDSWDCPSAIRL